MHAFAAGDKPSHTASKKRSKGSASRAAWGLTFPYCILEESGVGLGKSFVERGLCFPSQRRKPRNIEKLLRRPVWFRVIEHNLARITDHICNGSSKFSDRQICAKTNIDEFRTGIIFKDEHASIWQNRRRTGRILPRDRR